MLFNLKTCFKLKFHAQNHTQYAHYKKNKQNTEKQTKSYKNKA